MSLKLSEITNELTTISPAVDYRWYVYDPSEALETNRSKFVEKAAMLDYFGGIDATPVFWTPTIVTAGVTEARADGVYIKDGRTVILQFDVTWPATSDTNATFLIGVPTEADPYNNVGADFNTQYIGEVIAFDNVGSANRIKYAASINANTGGISFIKDTTTTSNVTNEDLSSKRLIGTITYISAT